MDNASKVLAIATMIQAQNGYAGIEDRKRVGPDEPHIRKWKNLSQEIKYKTRNWGKKKISRLSELVRKGFGEHEAHSIVDLHGGKIPDAAVRAAL